MNPHEVSEPILNAPFDEPREHWWITEHDPPERRPGRRPAMYFYRRPGSEPSLEQQGTGTAIELKLVNRVRAKLAEWRPLALRGEGGVTRTTVELLRYWRQEGRRHRLFFAQIEAAETIIFLTEARPDFLQGIRVPLDEPGEEARADGFRAFRRYACKMATGTGKTTVMGMLAAWSILNKVAARGDARFSDVVLIVCPNVTIRNRLEELKPQAGEASLYRTRDLVPSHLMPQLARGHVLVTNWHVFEPKTAQVAGQSAKVLRAGREIRTRETIRIGPKTTTARGIRYLTLADLERQAAAGLIAVRDEQRDRQGNLKSVSVESFRYVESDAKLIDRVLGREIGGKGNILVMNDEAHHAYRLRRVEPEEGEEDLFGETDDSEEFYREATVWVDGLDRVHKHRGINLCVDLSATPYYLGRVGQDANRPFPWVVSDFGLVDAIESGLVKIPQLAVRDTTGSHIPGYFNIWRWILPRLTPAERGGRRGSVKPEAVLKYAHVPVAMLGGLWELLREEWSKRDGESRPPVFIIVCKNTALAKVIYQWLAEDKAPVGIPPARLEGLRNTDGNLCTIRVDSKVVRESDSGQTRSDADQWMRVTLDTVGKTDWPRDGQRRPIYPEGFETLANKLERPLHPPGRDVRCIVSVGMLTEGWDCNTVTHIVGLRPFMSQLLCEQVVGRGLRRSSYAVGEDGKLGEEVAKIFGVPFEIVPLKENPPDNGAPPPPKTWRIRAVPEKAALEIRFPRVEGYTQGIRNRVKVDWESIAPLRLDPMDIPPEVEMKAGLPSNTGRPSLVGPGQLERVDLNPYRNNTRLQQLVFEMARDLTRDYREQPGCDAPPHVLFTQLATIVDRYIREKVVPVEPARDIDAFLSPWYGWLVERLVAAVRPDHGNGDEAELPRYESGRGPGSTAEVDFETRRVPYPVVKSHVNAVVPDTAKWEQSAAYRLDTHELVHSFVKNAGLGFAIPYLHNGEQHEYLPDFIVRLTRDTAHYLILETKGYDPIAQVKSQAAHRWVNAVNADRRFGTWSYELVTDMGKVGEAVNRAAMS
ncbi:MAG: DEAD/DEAH box helicase family protein [Deltaproteobacteria bacterium]|nr:DEAD/DEAH box helicase family protein [Deltaproteobacteria bacterium]